MQHPQYAIPGASHFNNILPIYLIPISAFGNTIQPIQPLNKPSTSFEPHTRVGETWGEIMQHQDEQEQHDQFIGLAAPSNTKRQQSRPMDLPTNQLNKSTKKKEEIILVSSVSEEDLPNKVDKQINIFLPSDGEDVTTDRPSVALNESQSKQMFRAILDEFKAEFHRILQECPKETRCVEPNNQKFEQEARINAAKKNSTEGGGGSNAQLPTIDLKLDRITIPTFDGDLTQWISFRDQFTSLVHQNSKLSPILKFTMLRSHLRGLALDAVNGFSLSNADYETAWNLILARYDKKDKIVEEYLRKLSELPKLPDHPTKDQLLIMINCANRLLRVLPNLGLNVTTWDP